MIFKVKKRKKWKRKERPYKINGYYVWGSSRKRAVRDLRKYLGESKFEKKIKKK